MENKQVIGTCSLCGGPVTQYTVLYKVGPWPAPSCEYCGAVMVRPHGPVIPMKPRNRKEPYIARRDRRKVRIVPDPYCEKDSMIWVEDKSPIRGLPRGKRMFGYMIDDYARCND